MLMTLPNSMASHLNNFIKNICIRIEEMYSILINFVVKSVDIGLTFELNYDIMKLH